jgi:nucleoside phosphorylase/uncharacterized protein YjbI with pentapeptide repeats
MVAAGRPGLNHGVVGLVAAGAPTALMLTALRVEMTAVLGHLGAPRSTVMAGPVACEVGHFAAPAGMSWRVVAAELGPGSIDTATAVVELSARFRPDVLMFAGIAGALAEDLNVGDVVAGTEVAWTERGKWGPGGYQARVRMVSLSAPLSQLARKVAREGTWTRRLSRPRPGARAVVGQIASGEKVVADQGYRAWLRAACPDALAIENEGFALARAAEGYASGQRFVVRGISDHADTGKSDQGQLAAASAAAAFTFELLDAWSSTRTTAMPGQDRAPVAATAWETQSEATAAPLPAGGPPESPAGHAFLCHPRQDSPPLGRLRHEAPARMFFDDYSDADLGRYYEITRGAGIITRRAGGLHFEIQRAPDGPSTEYDHLTVDALGRPHSPTRKAVVRFPGTEWTLEACLEYHFPPRRNGRQACFWLVHGADPGHRHAESVLLIRDADLDRDSLSVVVYDPDDGPSYTRLASPAADRYRLRIERSGARIVVYCGEEGHEPARVLERSVREDGAPSQCIVMNSASFAGEASFVLRSLSLTGAQPDAAPRRQAPVIVSASEVAAADIVQMLRAGQDIELRGCTITGTLDIGQVPSPVVSCIEMQDCDIAGWLGTTSPVDIAGWVSFLNCTFGGVGLSTASFTGSFRMSGGEFRGDSRFTGARFTSGANFSRCTFHEKASFRIAEAHGAVSFHHATFLKGADLSNAYFEGDLSMSDVAVREGGMSLYRSEVTGTLRVMATLERLPQPLGEEWDLSGARIGTLVISGGDSGNPRENTGPALWNLDSNVVLRNAAVGRLEFCNVHFARTLDVAGAAVRVRELTNATFGSDAGWPDFYSCFIAYSGKDAEFATKLRADLRRHGVRCFYAREDIKIGDEFRQRIGEAIRRHDKLLLIFSQSSVRSDWVQYEVEAALDRETRQRRRLLFPIRLDQAVMRTRREWAAMVRRRRHIGDFSNWRDPDAYQHQFQLLLRDLNARDQPPPTPSAGPS